MQVGGLIPGKWGGGVPSHLHSRAVEDMGNGSPGYSSRCPARHAEERQYLWGGWEAPFRDRGVGGLPAVVLCLPVLCGVACVPSTEGVVA